MKTRLILPFAMAAALFSTGTLMAEDASRPGNANPPDGQKQELREKFREAREAAMQDPNVVALQKQKEYLDDQYRAAIRAAILKNDPSLQPLLDKFEDERPGRFDDGKPGRDKGDKGDKGKFRDRKPGPEFSPEQREKMKETHEQIMNDPAVKAARDKLEAAQTREEKKAAMEELGGARKAALEKIDPELAKKFEEFGQNKRGQGKPQ